MAGRWVDVGEASRELDISTDAVRKRISRGSLRSERTDEGVRVWLDSGGTEAGREAEVDGGALVDTLQDQVAYLREVVSTRDEEIRRRDVIISQLTQRIPEIEAAPDQRPPAHDAQEQSQASEAGAEGPVEGAVGVVPQANGTSEPRGSAKPWWRRVFGG